MTDKDTANTLDPDDEATIDGIDLLGTGLGQVVALGAADEETIDGADLIAELKADVAQSQADEEAEPQERSRWSPPVPEPHLPASVRSHFGRLNLTVGGLVFAVCIAGSWYL